MLDGIALIHVKVPDYMLAIWYVGNSFRELNEIGVQKK